MSYSMTNLSQMHFYLMCHLQCLSFIKHCHFLVALSRNGIMCFVIAFTMLPNDDKCPSYRTQQLICTHNQNLLTYMQTRGTKRNHLL